MADLVPSQAMPRLMGMRALAPLRELGRNPALRRALPMLGTLAAIAIAMSAWLMLRVPPQRPVFDGLSDADRAAVAAALQTAGVPHSLDRSTGAVSVAEEDLHRARMLLAGQGLPKAAPSSDSVMAAIPLGVSRAVEGETLRAAREADLARTIEAIDTVARARVHLALTDPGPFLRDTRQSAASVMLSLQTGRTLDPGQVRAIAFLVASSVPGLPVERVSVVDQAGKLLTSRTGDDRTLAQQAATEDRIRNGLVTLLTPMLGEGSFSTEVHADMDLSESQSTRETFPKDDRALTREESNTSSRAESASAIGVPGAVSNTPPSATLVATGAPNATAPAVGNGVNEQRLSRAYDVGREVSVTRQPEGRLRRLSVALIVKQGARPRSSRDLAIIEQLAKGAVGFDAVRGDQIVVAERPFAVAPESSLPFYAQPEFLTLGRNGFALGGALLVLLLVGLPLRRAIQAATERAAERAKLESTLMAAASQATPVTIEMISAAPSYEARAHLVRDFVRQDPVKASRVVSSMIGGKPDA